MHLKNILLNRVARNKIVPTVGSPLCEVQEQTYLIYGIEIRTVCMKGILIVVLDLWECAFANTFQMCILMYANFSSIKYIMKHSIRQSFGSKQHNQIKIIRRDFNKGIFTKCVQGYKSHQRIV